MKETLFKHIKYKSLQLEQENQDLRGSLKELQEAQLQDASSTSALKKLRSNFQDLKQLHRKCSLSLKEKEAEWSSQIGKVTEDMKRCTSELKGKEKHIEELEKELEDYYDACDVLNGEKFVLILILKSELHTVRKEHSIAKTELKLNSKNLVHQKSEQATLLEEKLSEYKKMLEESYDCQVHLREHVLQLSNVLKGTSDASEEAKADLAKARAENEQAQSDARKTFDQEKASLLLILKKKDRKIQDLLKQSKNLEEDVTSKDVAFTAVVTTESLKTTKIKEKNKKEEQLETLLKASKKELEELKARFGNERMHLEARIQELESQKNDVLEENKKLSVDREGLLVEMQGIHVRMSEFCCEDVALARYLEKILEKPEEEKEPRLSNLGRDYHSRTPFSTAKAGNDERTPLVEPNC
ncbi:hypothetical protein K7X08_021422 [Anisodus acutangulus]|uniref:Uncharacterized protein n=1 Tax=Anisodus acutangulus TaxID=402998 RepID=A0A9Q1M2S3_9SOLA|nr:hypothetical protein K7X08_021422 [Anisodus acutangulus]